MDLIVIIVVVILGAVVFEWVSSLATGKDFYKSSLAKSLDITPPRYESDQYVLILQSSWHDDVFTIVCATGKTPRLVTHDVNKEVKNNGYFRIIFAVKSGDAASYEEYLKSYLATKSTVSITATGRYLYKCPEDDMEKSVKSALMFGYNEIVAV